MTAPIASGGRPFQVGSAAVLLTDSATTAGVLIINLSDQLVWLSGASSVGPSSGVPLQPQTSIPWTSPGQVWAALDPATAGGPATVLVSSAVTGWTASPAEIATKVAAQLYETGIPSVLKSEPVAINQPIASGQTLWLDVSDYASLNLAVGFPAGAANWGVEVLNANTAGGGTLAQSLILPAPANAAANTGRAFLPVLTATIGLRWRGPGTATATVYGTNRPVGSTAAAWSTNMATGEAYTAASSTVAGVEMTATGGAVLAGLAVGVLDWRRTYTGPQLRLAVLMQTADGAGGLITAEVLVATATSGYQNGSIEGPVNLPQAPRKFLLGGYFDSYGGASGSFRLMPNYAY